MLAITQQAVWMLILTLGTCAEPYPGVISCTPGATESVGGLSRDECEVAMGVELARPSGLVIAECTDGQRSFGGNVAAGLAFQVLGGAHE